MRWCYCQWWWTDDVKETIRVYSVDDDKGRVSDDLEETRFDDVEKKTQVSDDVEETKRDDVEKNSKVSDDVEGKRKSWPSNKERKLTV